MLAGADAEIVFAEDVYQIMRVDMVECEGDEATSFFNIIRSENMDLITEIFTQSSKSHSEKIFFVCANGLEADVFEKRDGGTEANDTRNIGCPSFETEGTLLVFGWIRAGVDDHAAAESSRLECFEECLLSKEYADTGWAVHLVSGKCDQIRIPLGYIDWEMAGHLRSIDDDNGFRIPAADVSNDFGNRIPGSKDIGES